LVLEVLVDLPDQALLLQMALHQYLVPLLLLVAAQVVQIELANLAVQMAVLAVAAHLLGARRVLEILRL
jgi:hypothetical protein